MKIELKVSFDSENPFLLIKSICSNLKPFNQELPDIVTDGFDEYKDTQNWIDELLPKYEFSATAYWGNIFEHRGFIDYDLKKRIVKIKISDFELNNVQKVIKMLAFSNDLRGVYLRGDRNLRVVIPAGKEITYSQMSDYCAAKHFQAFKEGDIDVLSFVFIVAAEAEPYLYDLWLRNIECFGFTPKGEEIRLDDEDYQPVYEPPEWVRRLESA